MAITGIDLFDQNICMVCAEVRVTCSWLSLVLIYLIKMEVRWGKQVRVRCPWISQVLIYLIKI